MPARKPFNKRAQTQLSHLKKLNRRYTTTQHRWADFFAQVKTKISELKVKENKVQGSELTTLKSELTSLETILDQARNSYSRKK